MPYLRDFTWEVFVSYAHRGIEEENKDPKGRTWTKRVVRQLRTLLSTHLHQDIRFFLDIDGLERDRDLTAGLIDAVDNSALLLVFVSPEYLASKWCTQEIDKFLSRRRWPDDPTRTGVFIIEAAPTDWSGWPRQLKDGQGNPQIMEILHKKPDDDELALSLPIGLSSDRDQGLLTMRLAKVAGRMSRSLKSLREQQPAAPPTSSPTTTTTSGSAPKRIYIAYPAHRGVRATQRRIAELLRTRGFDVIAHDRVSDFDSRDGFEQQVRANLEQSQALVQVLADENGQFDLTTFQYQAARALKRPIILWREPDLEASDIDADDDPVYAEFAATHLPEALTGDLTAASDRQALYDAIDTALAPHSPAPTLEPYRPGPNIFVYSVDPNGYSFVRDTLAPNLPALIRGEGCRVWCPTERAGADDMRKFEQRLPEVCDGLIVINSSEQELEVEKKISEFYTEFASRNPSKSLYIGIVERPPGMKFVPPSRAIEVFDCKDGKVKPNLRQWLRELCALGRSAASAQSDAL